MLTNFDIYAVAGGQDIANIQQFTAAADSNGYITIAFTRGANDAPVISGIEFLTVSSGVRPGSELHRHAHHRHAPLAVSFTGHLDDSPTAWSWTFGDTYTSTAQNPSHAYTAVSIRWP